MNLTLKTAQLKSALARVRPAVSTRTTLPVLNCVRLVGGDGLRISATTMDLWLDTEAEADVKTPGSVCVSFRKLSDAVAHFDGADTKFECSDKQAVITSSSSRLVLPVVSADEWPAAPEEQLGEPAEATWLPDVIKRLRPFASEDKSRYVINGVFLTGDKGVATSGRAMLIADLPVKTGEVNIPNDTCDAIASMKDVETLRIGENYVAVGSKTLRLVSNRIEGAFPDWKRIVPESAGYTIDIDRNALLDAADYCASVIDAGMNPVRFEQKNGNLTISAQDNDGETSRAVESSDKLKEPFCVSPKYLATVLRAFVGETVSLGIRDPISPITITQENATAILLPIRVG